MKRMKLKLVLALLTILVCALAVSVVSGDSASQVPQPQPVLPILVVNTGALNVRSGPGPQYSIITTVVGGTQLPVLATDPTGTWDLVSTAGGNGWVDISYTLPRGDFRYVPVVDISDGTITIVEGLPVSLTLATVDNSVPTPQLVAPRIVVNTGNLNVRTGPGPQFSILGTVPGGTVLSGVGVTPDGMWYLVQSPFGPGWIAAEYTLFRGVYNSLAIIPY